MVTFRRKYKKLNKGLSYVTKRTPSNKRIADRRDTLDFVDLIAFSNERLSDGLSHSGKTFSYDAKIFLPTDFQAQKIMQWDTVGLQDGDKLNLYHPASGLNDLLGIRNNDYLDALALLK